MPPPSPLLRPALPDGQAKVSFAELFFDLVFVFAVTQLSHRLTGQFTRPAVLETLFLVAAVWWVWIFTAWVTNWLDPERVPVRLGLFALMLAALLMSAALPTAFGTGAGLFAGCYVAMQVGRSLFFLWAVRGHGLAMRRNVQRIAAWLGLAALFWLAGAALEAWRWPLWLVALGLEVLAPALGFGVPGLGRSTTADWHVAGAHLAERCALFVIIALGESLLVTGATFARHGPSLHGALALLVSFAGSLALWWLYFDTIYDLASRRVAASADPGHLARLAYTYLHLFIVAGVIVNAAGDEFVLAHPGGHTDARTALCLLGGVGLFVLGVGLFKRAVLRRWPWSHGVALLLLAGAAPMSAHWPPVSTSAMACAVLVALAGWERHVRARWGAAAQKPAGAA